MVTAGKWNFHSALSYITRNSDARRADKIPGTLFVRRGSAGNGTLGAIDYINNHTKGLKIFIVSNEKYEVITGAKPAIDDDL